jgi:hypothetical protein
LGSASVQLWAAAVALMGLVRRSQVEDVAARDVTSQQHLTGTDGTLKRPIMQFIEWAAANVDYWIVSEARVANTSGHQII